MGNPKIIIRLRLAPDGDAILENIGPVNLSGLSLENAKKRLMSRFKPVLLRVKTIIQLL